MSADDNENQSDDEYAGDLLDLSDRPTVDLAVQEVFMTEIASLREKLAIRDNQIGRLVDIYVQHKRRLKQAAREAEVHFSQLPENPLLHDLNNSFRHEVVKSIVSLDSVNPTYFPVSHKLTVGFRRQVFDNMNDEYWLPDYLTVNNDNYGSSVRSWKEYGGSRPGHLPSDLDVSDPSPLRYEDLELEYMADMFSKPGCARTDCPIPSRCQVYYFEVTILCKGDEWYCNPEDFSQ